MRRPEAKIRCAARGIDLPDRRAPRLGLHAVLGDVAVRADGDVELRAVRARDHVLGPVMIDRTGRQLDHGLARRLDSSRPPGTESAPRHRCWRRRNRRRPAPCRTANAGPRGTPCGARRRRRRRLAQQRDAVGARHRGARPLINSSITQPLMPLASSGLGRRIGFGDQHVAVGQHVEPARMIEPSANAATFEALGRGRRRPLGPALAGAILTVGSSVFLGGGSTAPARCLRRPAASPARRRPREPPARPPAAGVARPFSSRSVPLGSATDEPPAAGLVPRRRRPPTIR